MKEIIQLNRVAEYNVLMGVETKHPLISSIDLSSLKPRDIGLHSFRIHYGLYAVYLKDTKGCGLKYGHSYYDYDEGTLVFFAPGQVVDVELNEESIQPSGRVLLFSPELLQGSELARRINDYGFFAYTSREALHLSERERQSFLRILDEISSEMEHAIDKHSRRILCSHIELMLNQCLRFYDRQFITREASNRDILHRFETLLSDYFESDKPQRLGFPIVSYFAQQLNLSPNYFGDLIKRETGKTAQEIIQLHTLERAKNMLLLRTLSISEIAYALGFEYPNHFTRLFKSKLGLTPSAFQRSAIG